jgi:hypothetical protein
MLFFPNLPIANLYNEQHNLENKDLENNRLKLAALFMLKALFVQICTMLFVPMVLMYLSNALHM